MIHDSSPSSYPVIAACLTPQHGNRQKNERVKNTAQDFDLSNNSNTCVLLCPFRISRPRPSLASAISTTTDDNHNDGRRRKVSSARAAIVSNNNNSNKTSSSESLLLSESKMERLDLLKELQAEIQSLKYENHGNSLV